MLLLDWSNDSIRFEERQLFAVVVDFAAIDAVEYDDGMGDFCVRSRLSLFTRHDAFRLIALLGDSLRTLRRLNELINWFN